MLSFEVNKDVYINGGGMALLASPWRRHCKCIVYTSHTLSLVSNMLGPPKLRRRRCVVALTRLQSKRRKSLKTARERACAVSHREPSTDNRHHGVPNETRPSVTFNCPADQRLRLSNV